MSPGPSAEIEGNQLITIKLRYEDSDNNGLTDFFENFDGNGLDPLNYDTDSDDLSDGDDIYVYFTSPLLEDTDEDGLNDFVEINFYITDPLDEDKDLDTMPDG